MSMKKKSDIIEAASRYAYEKAITSKHYPDEFPESKGKPRKKAKAKWRPKFRNPKGCNECPLYRMSTEKLVCYGNGCDEMWKRLIAYFSRGVK